MMTFRTLSLDQIPSISATSKRRIDQLIVHCSAVGPCQTSSAAQIDAWHRARGWQMIGYHFVIRRDGGIEVGRPMDMAGAHTLGHNAHSVGICYEGGLQPAGSSCVGISPPPADASALQPADTRTPPAASSALGPAEPPPPALP